MRLLAPLAALAVLAGCGWRTPGQIQRDYARTLLPAEVEATPAAPLPDAPPVRVLRVRAYADRDYQAQTLRWRQRIEDQLARATRVIEAQFGARLELVDVKDWQRTSRLGELGAAIEELVALDPARDVDWVVGFTSSLPLLTSTHDHLGLAHVFGRHLVLRGMDSVADARGAETVLDRLSAAEREELLRARRAHRETSVLLHEWAHTLGAFHERRPEWIMSPLYDKSQARFSRESAEIVALGLRSRDAPEPAARAAWGRAYRELVRRHEASAWDAGAIERAIELSHAALGAEAEAVAARPDERRAPEPPAAPAPAARREGAKDLHARCARAYERDRRAPTTLDACRAAAAAPGADLEVVLLVPRLLAERRDRPGAVRAIADAERVVAARQGDARSWLRIAQLYATVDACSGAERAASRLPASHGGGRQILADCARTRRWTGLRRGAAGVPPDREPEYVALVSQARDDVKAKAFDRARARASELARAFPQSAGAGIVSCLAEARAKAYAQAKPACAAAAAADDQAIIPQHVLGEIAAEEGRLDEARERLRRVLELDDGSGDAWTRLATVERRRGDGASLAALQRRYRDRFGFDLRAD